MHIGELIKQQIKDSQISIVWFARQLSYSRANVYKIFASQSIDTNTLYRISLILKFDFFTLYSKKIEEQQKSVSKS